MREYSKITLWKDVTPHQWTDWHWQLQNAIIDADALKQVIHLSDQEQRGVQEATRHLKMKISPHIITLMDPNDPSDVLRRQFVPSAKELVSIDDASLFADVDPGERYSPVSGVVHRYPTKALLLATNYCGSFCRYCFRRKLVRTTETSLRRHELEMAIEYIRQRPQIEEVILSGGDPLVLGDDTLEYILSSLNQIPHVQILRLHTRLPVTIPYRITSGLVSILNRYKPVYVVIHIDTPREISEAMRESVARLVDNGIPCLASCPLLRGINDDETVLRTLWTELIKMRVKPYYLFHSDPVKGIRHFMVPISRGLEIMRNLYDRMSGLAMPHYCFNVPSGGGHILLGNNYVEEVGEGRYIFTTFEGERFEYSDGSHLEGCDQIRP